MKIFNIFSGETYTSSYDENQLSRKYRLGHYEYNLFYYNEEEIVFSIAKNETLGRRIRPILKKLKGVKLPLGYSSFKISKILVDKGKETVVAFHIVPDDIHKFLDNMIRVFSSKNTVALLPFFDEIFKLGIFPTERYLKNFTWNFAELFKCELIDIEQTDYVDAMVKAIYYLNSKEEFNSYFAKLNKAQIVNITEMDNNYQLLYFCYDYYMKNISKEQAHNIILDIIEKRSNSKYLEPLNAIARNSERLMCKINHIDIYVANKEFRQDGKRQLKDNFNVTHNAQVDNLSGDWGEIVIEKAKQIKKNTLFNIRGAIYTRDNNFLGYVYDKIHDDDILDLNEVSTLSQVEQMTIFGLLKSFIFNSKYTDAYSSKTHIKGLEDVIVLQIGNLEPKFKTIEDYVEISSLKKENRKKLLLDYFKKIYITKEDRKLRNKEDILKLPKYRYLSASLARNVIKYINKERVDQEEFANDLIAFLENSQISKDKKIIYSKDFYFDPSTTNFILDFENNAKLHCKRNMELGRLYTIVTENNNKVRNIENKVRWEKVEFARPKDIVIKYIASKQKYEVVGFNRTVKLKENLNDNVLIHMDNVSLAKYFNTFEHVFIRNQVDNNYIYLTEENNYAIDLCENIVSTKSVKGGYFKEKTENLKEKGLDLTRLDDVKDYIGSSALELELNKLTCFCTRHNMYYSQANVKCPICLKTEYYLNNNRLNSCLQIYEDKYAIHYKLDSMYNIKLYKKEVLDLEKIEATVDEIVGKTKIQTFSKYLQDLFIPLKKVYLNNEFAGTMYESVSFNDSSKRNYIMSLLDIKNFPNKPRFMACVRLLKQVSSLQNRRFGFIYNPYGTVYFSKEHLHQVQLVYPEFIKKECNVDVADDWTIDYVNEVFSKEEYFKTNKPLVAGDTTLESAYEQVEKEVKKLGNFCDKHKMYYSVDEPYCPACIPKYSSKLLKDNSIVVQKDEIEGCKLQNEGGESFVYNYKGEVAKLYKEEIDAQDSKLAVLIRLLNNKAKIEALNAKSKNIEYILPNRVILSSTDRKIIGYTMKKVNGFSIDHLRDKKFIEDKGYTKADVLEILINVGEGIKTLHDKANIYIGDLNGRNILVDKHKRVYFIDLDGIGIEEIKPEFFTDGYVVPLENKEQNITMEDDWYSFAIQAFYYLTYTHPFNGIYDENGVKLDTLEKMTKRISLLGNHGVVVPTIADDWSWMRDELKEAFLDIFEKDKRINITPLLQKEYNIMKGIPDSENTITIGKFVVMKKYVEEKNIVRFLSRNSFITKEGNNFYACVKVKRNKVLKHKVQNPEEINKVYLSNMDKYMIIVTDKNITMVDLNTHQQINKPAEHTCLKGNRLYFVQNIGMKKNILVMDTTNFETQILTNFLNEYCTLTLNVSNGDKYLFVKEKDKKIHEVYCNQEKVYEFKGQNVSQKYTALKDNFSLHWLVLGDNAQGIIISSDGAIKPFKIQGVSNINVKNIVYYRENIYIQTEDKLIIYNGKEDTQKTVEAPNIITKDSIVYVYADGFDVYTLNNKYEFRIQK